MEIELVTKGKWKIFSITGRLDAQTTPKLEDVLKTQMSIGTRFIALDLSSIEYISSSGLRVLLATLKLVKANQGSMVLIKPASIVNEVLETSGFTRIFMVSDSIEGLV